jgi:hypothetical protein
VRGAAISLSLCAALILGFTALLLETTVWNQPSEPEPAFYFAIPGVDLSPLSAEARAALLRRLNAQGCPCGCMRTVAGCRNRHTSCTLSLAEARARAAALISADRRPPAPASPNSK